MKAKRRMKGRSSRGVAVSVDCVTDIVVKAVMTRENISFSAALCALATHTALRDPDLVAVIRDELTQAVRDRLDSEGWHPGLSAAIARELVTGETEKLTWN